MFTIEEQIKAVEREISMRKKVYPRRVAMDQMGQSQADYQIAVMEAVKETLLKTAPSDGLFGGQK